MILQGIRVYSATFASGGSGDALARLASASLRPASPVRLLCSYHYWRDVDLRAFFGRYDVEIDVLVDSGAFTAASIGVRVTLAGYAAFLRKNSAVIGAYTNLDVIGDHVRTRRNQEVLESEGLAPIPVFHYGSPFEELERLVERYERVAIGGLVPLLARARRPSLLLFLDEVFERGVNRHPGVKLHGFGVTTWEIVRRYRWDSIDSSLWAMGPKFGEVVIFDEKLPGFRRIALGDLRGSFASRKLLGEYGVRSVQLVSSAGHALTGAIGFLSMQRAEEVLCRACTPRA